MNLRIPSPRDTKQKLKKIVASDHQLFEYKLNLGSLQEGDSLKKAPDGSWKRFYN
jgi:hypothetical protein